MHARHRSPGNGVKSNSMGMGVTAARISPESSIRGHGMYNLEYRNFNRGLGRGFPKPYPPPQRPRRSDIFMEAGRLAAEYLVSQGLLPHSVLPGKWQNSSSKNQTGDFQEFKSQDRGNLQLPSEARMSALARLGNVVPDAGSGRRRFPDEFNPSGSRSHMRGRRKMGSSRGWGRDSGKNGSWSDKIRFSSDMEGEDEFVSVHHEERSVVSDGGGGVQKAVSSELTLKSANAGDSESELESYEFPSNDAGPKVMSSSDRKGVSLDTDGELNKGSDDSKISHLGTEELKHGTTNHETEEQDTPNFPMQNGAMEGEIVTKNGNDLLRLCCFAKVPTKTRSSLTFRGSKVSAVHINEEEKASNVGHPTGSLVHVEEDLIEESSGNVLKSTIQSSKIEESDTCRSMSVHPVENAVDMDSDSILETAKCLNSQSFSDGSFLYEQESSHGPPGFGRCNSMIKERGEKRAVEHEDNREGTKKPREWPSSPIVQDVEYFHPCNLGKDQSSSKEEGHSSNEQIIDGVDQEKLVNVVMFPKDRAEFEGDLKDEKQHFPSSFKICDLNLMEAPDMTENHGGDMVLGFPSILEERKEAQMVVGLSMSNSSSKSDDRDRCLTDAKMVESVRVGNESAKEDVTCDTSKGKTDIVYSGLESFPNHLENPADLPDVQDGYGLMISELLGADISNCPSVSTDMAALHTEMGLHNGEVMMAEDDSIYLSLGEIPLSLLGVWEQPSQEYGKPF